MSENSDVGRCLGSLRWLQRQANKPLCNELIAHALQIDCLPLAPATLIKLFSDQSALISRINISLGITRQPIFQETRLSTSAPHQSDFFTRAFTALAILGPILLVIFAGRLPDGMRGNWIVNGHIFIVAALSTALALRAVYGMGFSRARELLASSLNRSLTE